MSYGDVVERAMRLTIALMRTWGWSGAWCAVDGKNIYAGMMPVLQWDYEFTIQDHYPVEGGHLARLLAYDNLTPGRRTARLIDISEA